MKLLVAFPLLLNLYLMTRLLAIGFQDLVYVTGSEKRGHFGQNANFYHFSNCHHAKAFRALGFPLALHTL